MNIPNYGLLNPKPTNPAGYVSKDLMWAAVPWGNKFVILHNGNQVHESQNYASAKSYIQKQLKMTKPKVKPTTSSLENFL